MKTFLIIITFLIFSVPVIGKDTSTPLEKRQNELYKEYEKLADWIKKNSSINIYVVYPKILFLSKEKIQELSETENETVALYNPRIKTIILRKTFDLSKKADKSILIHEMIHHYQSMNNMIYQCNETREYLAYSIQKKWADQNGLNFHKDFVGKLFYILMSQCPYF